MRRDTKDILFRKLLAVPLQLHLHPTFVQSDDHLTGQPAWEDIVIYVEPPSAPGLKQVISKLRRQVRATAPHEKIEQGHTQLSGNGLRAGRKTQSTSSDIRLEDDRLPQFMAEVCYRLIVTDRLTPIGYCTFCIQISHWQDVEVDLDEVWLARDYRGKGIGQAMAEKVADIAILTLEELDARVGENSRRQLGLDVYVGGDVYSRSGESFVRCTCDALIAGTDFTDWHTLRFTRFGCDARW
ncbi:GNAT family N-acetyltransferase [Paraburkholderia strydomiana]|uniref:GNAT family N-acetyltransferase n=1 Tax=Paraburkholderia strydomiana TaxID=1245417 RepID=A0ABW9EGT0_9BURK